MKTKARKQEDLNALAEKLSNSKSAMIVSFNKLTVNKDQEFRHQLREAGAEYQVVKNTIARLAVKGTPFEDASEHFKGVTAIAWTENDPVVLSKTISKFIKENTDFYTLKAGVVDGKVFDAKQIEAIASLPSKEVLISKLLYVLNAQAQRIVTVINAVPRNLAIVIKQIGEGKTDDAPAEQKTAEPAAAAEEQPKAEEATAETPVAEEAVTETPAPEETAAAPEATAETPEASAETQEAPEAEASAATEESSEAAATETETASATEEAPAESTATEAEQSSEESAAPVTTEEATPEAEEKSE
jgi:large subunit ribosomal protein L10